MPVARGSPRILIRALSISSSVDTMRNTAKTAVSTTAITRRLSHERWSVTP